MKKEIKKIKKHPISSRIEDIIWEWEQANISQYDFISKLKNILSDYEWYIQDVIITINKLELASELAHHKLKNEWARSGLGFFTIQELYREEEDDTIRYTEEAQDVFNEYYDEYLTLIESIIK